jgi:hypothetical protein
MPTLMSRSLEGILRDLHGPVQRRMWSNNFIIPHNSETEVLSMTMIHKLVFLLRPVLSHDLRVLQPRTGINDRFREGFNPYKRA